MSIPGPRHSRRTGRLLAVLCALLLYAAINAAMLAQPVTPHWDLRVDGRGIITWVDPGGPAGVAGISVGERLLRPETLARQPYAEVAQGGILLLRSHGKVSREVIPPALGPTREGQALILIGVLVLMVGGLAWAYGRRGRAPVLLAALSAAMALALLGDVWGHDGYRWAVRLGTGAGNILFPVAWAALFVSFPRNRVVAPRWRVLFRLLLALAVMASVAYNLRLLAGWRSPVLDALSDLIFLFGLLLGLVALARRAHDETTRERQQRRLVAASAAGAILPLLLLSFVFDALTSHPLVPYQVAALGLVVLPLGLAYAIVRYDLMELDVVVRRLVAVALGAIMLVGGTVLASMALGPLLPATNLFALVIAVLAGALGGRYVHRWAMAAAERLLSPELIHSRRVLDGLDPALLRGEADLGTLSGQLEAAARAVARTGWARLLVRRRVSGAVFALPRDGGAPVALPVLTAALERQRWGVAPGDPRLPAAPHEWAGLAGALPEAPAVLVPLRIRGEVIAVLAVAERSAAEPLCGPDREALALVAAHFALAVDYACIRADLETEGADAAAFSAASAELTAALDDRAALSPRIVATLARMRDVAGAALVLFEPDGTPTTAASEGEAAWEELPRKAALPTFASLPFPRAWLPLFAGGEPAGGLCLRWCEGHAIREHERRLLAVYADGVAMALEHARLYERARIQAERDPVTDLYNHRAFHTRLEAALKQAQAGAGHIGVLLIDLADFKLFNDTHGHQAGDNALRRVAEVLRSCGRTSDVAARLGGDEFAVLLPDSDLEAARIVAERITDLAAISALTSPEGHHLPVRFNIGVATFPADAATANALLTRADERMYEAKRAGVAVSTSGRPLDEIVEADGSGRFGILEALVAMVDNRDRYTGEHSEQVATYACALGAELGLAGDTLATLRLAGLLHDVGKIGVPDRILRKPARLTDEEFEVVRRHVELSEALLAVVSQDPDLMDAVRYHHERWDGKGYPRGVAGEAVPLLGRIMIVADAVSAMGMDRPYRKGLRWEAIAQELTRGAGGQFDPHLVAPALRALAPHLAQSQAA